MSSSTLPTMGDGISLTVRDLAQAQTRSIQARYLLACDGANSFVRRKLGISYEDLAFDEWWIVVDAWQRRPTALPEMNTQYCWPSRPASAIAGPRNLRRWELKILPHEKPEEFQDEARVREVLAGFVDIDAIELWRSAVYRFHALVAAQWNRNRIFLLGDCAHQMPPFLGQGMCAGIRDAANLIWKLLLVEKSGVSRTVLSTYQDERKTHVQNVVAQAKELGLVIGELDVAAATARDARLRAERLSGEPARHRLIPPLTRGLIDRDHRGEPTKAAGSLFPQPRVAAADGRIALLDDILPPAFLVVSGGMDVQAALSDRELEILRRARRSSRRAGFARGRYRGGRERRDDPRREGRTVCELAGRNRGDGGGGGRIGTSTASPAARRIGAGSSASWAAHCSAEPRREHVLDRPILVGGGAAATPGGIAWQALALSCALSCVVRNGSRVSMLSTGSYRHLKKRRVMLSDTISRIKNPFSSIVGCTSSTTSPAGVIRGYRERMTAIRNRPYRSDPRART